MSSDLRPENEALQSGVRSLAEILLAETSAEVVLACVASLAADSLPGCEAASVSLMQNGQPTTPVCSAPIAAEVDQFQYQAREGPCLSAIDTGAVVRVDSFPDDTRWPTFAERAAARGMISSLSYPLIAADEVLGALNMYSRHPDNFLNAEQGGAAFARQASITLSNAVALRRARDLAQQLAAALENRDIIGQAKGIIMAAEGVSSDRAFEVLRRASQRTNRKLHEVAREIVERRQRREPDLH